MLLSIFEWLTQCIAGALDAIVDTFLECLDLDISIYLEAFPAFADIYELLQIVGLGLTLLVGVVGLFIFLFLRSSDMKYVERPEQILIKTAVATGMIYYGGHILEYIVKLASWSFAMFNAIDAAPMGQISNLFSAESLGEVFKMLARTGTVTELVLVTVALLLTILVAYNLLKLILEVAERFLMVGVLVFTSPLAYCTIASNITGQIFKRWASMFISSCIMMSMSALFLKLIVNGLFSVEIGEKYFLQLLLVLAMCKIAQRIDSYMKSLGLSVAETGGGLLSDLGGVIAAARTIGAAGGVALNGGKGSRNSVLGGAGNAGPGAVRASGPVASAINGIRQTRAAFVNGASVSESVKAGAKAAGETMKRTPYGGAIAGAVQAKREGTSVTQGAVKGAASGIKESMAQYAHPTDMNARRANMAEQQRVADEMRQATGVQQDADNVAAASQAASFRAGSAGEPVPQEVKDRIHDENGKPFTASEANANFAAYGVAENGQSALTPSGAKAMADYRQQAISELQNEDAAFAADYAKYEGSTNGTYKPGSANYMSESDFNGKWGDKIAANTASFAAEDSGGDGIGMALSDNALASGLSLQSVGGDQMCVQGGEDQVGAFLANEYNRYADPVNPMQGIKSDAEYKDMAIASLADNKEPIEGFDRKQFRSDMDVMDKDDFMAKYSGQIKSRAAEHRSSDIKKNTDANTSYRDTVANTATYSSPNASVHAFFDSPGVLEKNDRLGNAMMEQAFSVIAADRADGESFTDIKADNRPNVTNEVTKSEMSGGRVVEAKYINKQGIQETVRIYDETAYSSMTDRDKEVLRPYKLSTDDNRTFWTTANIGGAASYAEKRVRSTSSRRASNASARPQTGKGTGHTMPPRGKK